LPATDQKVRVREQEQFLATTRKVIPGTAETETLQENLTVAYQDACHRHRGMLPDLEAPDASIWGTPARPLARAHVVV
jgi:hypothetical protein